MKTPVSILVLLFSFLFSLSSYSETIKLKCVCQKLQRYNFETDKIEETFTCSDSTSPTGEWIEYIYLNPEEKWVIPRGSENNLEKREKFTEVTQDYYYAEFYIGNEIKKEIARNKRSKAIEDGKESLSEPWYYVRIDRYTLEYIDGGLFGDYFVKEKKFKPTSKHINTFSCEKIDQQL